MLALENQSSIQLVRDGMEIEMNLSVTKAIGNLTFTSTETEAVYILLGHLPGFLQDKIELSVNETGTEISIIGAGEKSFFETVIGSRLRLKNEFENNSFRKVFRIPIDVVLDQINACFCEDEAILMILMPKSSIGEVSGREIQEVVEQEQEQEEAPKEKETEGDTKIQIGTTSSASERYGDGEPEHMEAEYHILREKQEEPGKITYVPEYPSAKSQKSAVNGEPALPAVASKAIDEEENEEQGEKKSSQNQQPEKGDEKHESYLSQPKGHQTDREQQKEQSETAQDVDQHDEREKEAELTEAPKSNGDVHQTDETSETVKRIEAPVREEHELPQSIKADRDREQPEEKKDPRPEAVQTAETNEMEQQKEREQAPESIETFKYEEPPEMDQRSKAPIEEEDEEGKGRNWNRQQAKKKDPEPETVQTTETKEMEQQLDREHVPEPIKTPKYEESPEMDLRSKAPIEEEDEEGEGRNWNRQQAIEPDTAQTAETNEMEQQENTEQVPESIATPKHEEPPEMDQRSETPIEDEDEKGEGRNRNRQKASVRKNKRDRDVSVPVPSLMFSAFIFSLVALVVELVRTRRRR